MTRNRRRPHFEWIPAGPLPDNLSPLAVQVANLALSVPRGRWVSWGDLGDVLGTTGKAVADAGLTLSPTPGKTLMPHNGGCHGTECGWPTAATRPRDGVDALRRTAWLC
jgi:hypothetical protein